MQLPFIAEELKKRRFRWLGHVLRMTNERLPKVALRWTPPGKRKPGRPRTTWRRTVLAALQDLGYSLGQAQHLAKGRVKWRKLVAALCPTRDEEDRYGEVGFCIYTHPINSKFTTWHLDRFSCVWRKDSLRAEREISKLQIKTGFILIIVAVVLWLKLWTKTQRFQSIIHW